MMNKIFDKFCDMHLNEAKNKFFGTKFFFKNSNMLSV
jgi:hypothetical protein